MKAKKAISKKDTKELAGEPLIKSSNLFPVVGIGASAGGLDAFKKLLKAIPDDSGMAYVLVQHLDPTHESLLPEILQKITKIPVIEITDDLKVQPDHIYVIPSNKMMVATDGVLLLTNRKAKSNTERNLPIDLFFKSLAEVHQEHAIGIVLSGTASDGTQGLKAIKDHGGITFAQDETSAEYEGMPHSAIEAGVVDFILPPEKMPKKLIEVTGKIVVSDEELQKIPKQDEDIFKQILSLIRVRKEVDFTYYKQTTVRRRILRRMVVNKNEETGDYLKFLRGNNQEQDLLYQDMLIPVTSFFRDKKTFEDLCTYVFPVILKNKVPGEITRIWVAGCSTGQEAYSFAICFKEFLGDNYERIQIFGTDLSEIAITKARLGLYEKSEIDTVSPERLKDYFTKNNGGYQVNKSIRDMCVFAHHNFLKDPPFGKMDVISSRNVLIYMEPYLQKKALTTFHYALNPKGFLLLGKSETIGSVDLFAVAEKNDKLYTRKDVPGRFIQVASQRSEKILNQPADSTKSEPIRTDFQKTADDILLTKYTPAGVVVNETMDIMHFRGNTANYLEQAPGKPSHNLLMMAKNGLGFELRNILHKAKTDLVTVVKENIPLIVNGNLRNISIEAVPLPNTLEPYYLVLFHENNLNDTDVSPISNRKKASVKTKKEEKDIQIKLLEQELAQAREDMRSITEDQEASNEELQSANEELLSGSEELQSLNEELETSKEELQSTNEELTVLNYELINLNEEITDARNYSESIVSTLYQPLLVLDKNLRVKTANQAFYKTFRVNEQETEGVLIYDLGNRQWNIPELRTLLEEILPQKKQITDFEVTHNFLSIGERAILLSALELTREKKEQKLILLSIEDITEKKKAENNLRASEQRFRSLVEQATYPICILKGESMILEIANEALLKIWGVEKESLGKPFLEILPEMKDQPFTGWLQEVYKNDVSHYGNEEPASFIRKDGTVATVYFNFSYLPFKENDGSITGVMIVASDVTQQVLARKKIEESEERFRNMAESSDILIAVNNETINAVYFNKPWEKLTGRSVADLLNLGWADLLHPDDKEPFMNKFLTAYNNKTSHEGEFRILNKEGTYSWLYAKVQVRLHPDGSYAGHISSSIDVTERKNNEKALLESETKFRTLIEDAPIATCLFTGKEMRIEIANEIMIKYWGKRKNVIGKPLADAVPELKGQPFLKILEQVYTTGKIHYGTNEVAQLKLNGVLGTYYFDYTYKPIRNAAGEVYGIMNMAVDVTEKVLASIKIAESEKQFRQMAELIPQKIWTADAEGNKTYFNKTLLDYAGLTFEELKGSGWQKIVHPDDWGKNKTQWEKCISSGKPYETENRLLRKDGKYLWHLTRAVAVIDNDGKISSWVGSKTEIQDQKEETQAAEDAVKAKQQFLSNMSHEIRTPLNAIIGFTKVVLKTGLTAKQKEYLTAIKLSGNSLIVLINDILDLAKVDAGKMIFEEIPFKMSSSIAAMIHLFETKIQEKNLELVKEYDNKIPEVLLGDPVRLHQIILNLVSNAVKFTSKGKITVSLHLLKDDEEKVTIQFAVADTGTGIAPDKIEKIFEKFQQASSDTSRLYGGTGLGLSIVKQLVEAQGGTIQVTSEVGNGSVFGFTLDFKKTDALAEAEPEMIEPDAENKNIKVLVVEDIALNQLLMKTLLDDFGFERDIAANGKIAIEKLQEKNYDIILMDLQMPEMNGFEATEHIRNVMHSQIPIIALTADVTSMDMEKCKAVGMNDYIAKPVDERILYSKIVGLVKKPAEKKNPVSDTETTAVTKKINYTDLTYLTGITKFDTKLMMEMIELYLQQTPVLISGIKTGLANKDWDALHAAAHKMIPSFSIMGISKDYERMAKQIQEYSGKKNELKKIQELALKLEHVCNQACTELEEEYNTLKNTRQ